MIDGNLNPAFRHGYSRKGRVSPEYMVWGAMMQRCNNPANKGYKDYGARGISVCERWKTFANFIADVGPRPAKGFTLERIDNNHGYSPDNCKWVTRTRNNNNKRNNIRLSLLGIEATAAQWSQLSPVTYRAFHKRIGRGWTLEQALKTPHGKHPV